MVMKKVRHIYQKLLPVLKNKYAMTLLVLFVWMTFFDESSFISTIKNRIKLAELRAEKEHYQNEIAQSTEDLKLLKNDKELLEKFARERYLMKRENEDIFVFAIEED